MTVEFTNIKINDCYQLIEGTVQTKYDPSWSNVVDVDKSIDMVIDALKLAFAELKSLMEVFTGSAEDIARLKEIRERIEQEKTNIQLSKQVSEADKQASLNSYTVLISQILSVEQNPSLCTGSNNSTENVQTQPRNARIEATATVCPLNGSIDAAGSSTEDLKKKDRKCNSTKRYPGSLIGTVLWGNKNDVFSEGDFPKENQYIQNISLGALAHLLIETYYKTTVAPGQDVELEFSIPRPLIAKYTGFADIANKTTGEIFEIKSVDGASRGELEAKDYVQGGTDACPNTPAWHLGTNFPAEVRIPWPTDPFKQDLVVTKPTAGVVAYQFARTNRKQPIPTIVPNSKQKDVNDLLTQIMQEVVQSPFVLTPLKLNQLILTKLRALTPSQLRWMITGMLVGTAAYFILNGVVSVGSGGTAVAAQIPLYAAGVAITAVCLKIIDDNYQINTNDNYYSQ